MPHAATTAAHAPPGFRRRIFTATATRRAVDAAISYAHGCVARALKRGRIERPSHCQRCGAPSSLTAHHRDYDAPLAIVWLCDPCHRQEHAHLASIGRDPAEAVTWRVLRRVDVSPSWVAFKHVGAR